MNSNFQVGTTMTQEECTADQASKIAQIGAELSSAGGWMKLVAVMAIIGAITSIVLDSLWNILFIWLPIWTSVLLFQAASHASNAAGTGSAVELRDSLDRLRLYFKITGILTLIGLIIMVIGLFFAIPFWFSIGM